MKIIENNKSFFFLLNCTSAVNNFKNLHVILYQLVLEMDDLEKLLCKVNQARTQISADKVTRQVLHKWHLYFYAKG